MLGLDRIGKRYGRGPWVLRDVDLAVEPGELVVVAGGNGSGKSTLLRVAAGLTAPTTGRVRRPASVGYLPERFPAGVGLSARAYLGHLAAVRGVPARWDLLEALGFVGDDSAPMARLSKGNAQKVALVQALQATDLLVLDEPWSGLDAAAGAVLGELVATAREEGAAVLLTDHHGHDLPDARELRLTGGSPTGVVVELDRVGGLLARVSELDGVLAATAVGGGARLEVRRDASDGVLAEVLRLGCSVRSVRS
ncbi:ABC transporter ATP-binding protein [Saccharothrix coeruleofusca]|uniref:ABC transporter ATP-binding protein n=1 Tax=Saccharothrix coeruleofusca TaxID=33919 RepID=A0A918AT21_9PSEU|nr:ATP-binding cassette domain-containing protein [Saccharothrix coeruleofusca]MBP2337073.1 ABC-type multidrug transport system ATPase subunit [Saccharothrix coeruleofusca]GGP67353.1 ABC transporter ATP-binding protein [Saccharothrix coeruleofusca]